MVKVGGSAFFRIAKHQHRPPITVTVGYQFLCIMVIHPGFRGQRLVVTKECMVHNEIAPRFYPWQHRFESRGYIALWPDRSPRPWTCKIQWAGLTEQSWTNASANETFCEQSLVEIVRNFPEILWEPKSPERTLRLWEVRMWSHPRLWQEKSIYGFCNRVTKKKGKVMMKGVTMSWWYVDRLSSSIWRLVVQQNFCYCLLLLSL